MPRMLGNSSYALAPLALSLLVATPAIAQTPSHKYGFCYGMAGNPRVTNFTRAFVLGPSAPPGSLTAYFMKSLQEKYDGFTTMENDCPMYSTAAEAETGRRQLLDQVRGAGPPPVEFDWIPKGATPLPGAAAPGASSAKPQAPAPVAAAAPATDPASTSCREMSERPSAYIGQTVSALGVAYMVSATTIEGKTVMLQIYACSDALGTVQDYEHLFALAPREATTDAAAGNRPVQRIAGTVQSALEVLMPSGRMQVKKVMPFLRRATIRGP